MPLVKTVHLGLGTNLGDRIANMRAALEKIASHVNITKRSSVYITQPQGVGEQPYFYNMAIEAETELGPHELLDHVKSIEQALGEHTHNEPRVIDIDILLIGDEVHETAELSVPHPRMHERAFVLAPLMEIAHLTMHPLLGKCIADLEDALGPYGHLCMLADEQL